jgi:hypothetical protein
MTIHTRLLRVSFVTEHLSGRIVFHPGLYNNGDNDEDDGDGAD